MPFFSVVIPLFNKEKHIKDSIKSVLSQTFGDFEIVVVDDGSTDGSLNQAKAVSDSRIKIYSQKNAGAAAARNFGVENANGEHVALLDADDVWEPNHLEEHRKSVQKFPRAELYCNAYRVKLPGGFSHEATYNITDMDRIQMVPDYFGASIIHPIAHTSAVVFKKKDFDELGGFDPKVLSGQDIDLWIRFALKKTLAFNPAVTSSYDKTVENSLSKGNYRESKYELFDSFPEEEKLNASLKKYLDLNRYSLAIQCKYFGDRRVLGKLKSGIAPSSLNFKQKLLLNSPSFVVRGLKRLYLFLLKKNVYLTTYR